MNNTTESIQIHLNSKFATSYNNNNNSDCNFSLPNIEIEDGYYIHLSVQSCVIPYSFYNIDSTNNVLFYQEILVDGNGAQTGTINTTLNMASGNYNALQLASYLTSNLPRTTVSYSTITGKYTFGNSTNNFIIKSQYSTCLSLIGCSTNDLYNTSALKSLTSYTPANLSPRQCICVSSNLPTGNINNQLGSNRSIICSIPVVNQPFSLITYNNVNGAKFNLYSNFINFLNIKLSDQNGALLNLNGQNFSITLQLDIIKFLDE
jgi:hypothetical protein